LVHGGFRGRDTGGGRPEWLDVVELRFASGTSAAEAVIHDAAGLTWVVDLACVDLNPHAVHCADQARG
jgi:DNA primase